jgi:hypothetical protein
MPVAIMVEGRWRSAEQYLDALEEDTRNHSGPQPPASDPLADLMLLWLPGERLDGAACANMDCATIEHLVHPHPHATIGTLAAARSVCFGCPALRACLRGALSRNERYGIWAGTSRRNRIRIRIMINDPDDPTTLDQVLNDFTNGATERYDQLMPGPLEEESPA